MSSSLRKLHEKSDPSLISLFMAVLEETRKSQNTVAAKLILQP